MTSNKTFRRILAGVVVIGICFESSWAIDQLAPNDIWVFGGGFLGICIFVLCPVTFVIGLTSWRKVSRYWIMPSLVCFGLLVLSNYNYRLAWASDDLAFRMQFASYEAVAAEVASGTIRATNDLSAIALPSKYHLWRCKGVHAVRCDNGDLLVEFFLNVEGRVRSGYLYENHPGAEACIEPSDLPERRFRIRRQVAPGWYFFLGGP